MEVLCGRYGNCLTAIVNTDAADDPEMVWIAPLLEPAAEPAHRSSKVIQMPTNHNAKISGTQVDQWLALIREFLGILADRKKQEFNRRVSIGDLLSERSDNAAAYGFGEGTTMYDNVLVLGDVRVGRNTWIGPGCVLDGSGGQLQIGDWCSISAGAQIYTHHTVNRSISLGEKSIEYTPTKIGNGVYIGPNTIVQMGVTIGDKAIIGANSFVNRDVPPGAKAFGSPARIHNASVEKIPSGSATD
jgi:acetyltransferase-like isoleucine patch superfamily enzyme